MQDIQATVLPDPGHVTYVNVIVNVTNLLAISEQYFDNTGEPAPQAKGVNHHVCIPIRKECHKNINTTAALLRC